MPLKDWEKVGTDDYVSKKDRLMQIRTVGTGQYTRGIAHAFVEVEEHKLARIYYLTVEVNGHKKSIPAKNKALAHKRLMSLLRSKMVDPHIQFNAESEDYFART